MAAVRSEGINTVVLVPVTSLGQSLAVLELCSVRQVPESAEAEGALRSIATEIATAHRRLLDAATANQWGRRRR
jgi:GAF domain-containing protein